MIVAINLCFLMHSCLLINDVCRRLASVGEMMMSLLWYYRPEHTESEKLPRHISSEIFASKHRDENSVACIEDKCYVLTLSEYCRYGKHSQILVIIKIEMVQKDLC